MKIDDVIDELRSGNVARYNERQWLLIREAISTMRAAVDDLERFADEYAPHTKGVSNGRH